MVQFLQLQGCRVVDLGVDVSPPTFIQAVRDHSCTALFLSGLLTVSYEPMRLTLQELEKSGLRETVKVVIGGLVSERVRQFVRADHWANDCTVGINLCRSILFPGNLDSRSATTEDKRNDGRCGYVVSHDSGRAACGAKGSGVVAAQTDRIRPLHRTRIVAQQ